MKGSENKGSPTLAASLFFFWTQITFEVQPALITHQRKNPTVTFSGGIRAKGKKPHRWPVSRVPAFLAALTASVFYGKHILIIKHKAMQRVKSTAAMGYEASGFIPVCIRFTENHLNLL